MSSGLKSMQHRGVQFSIREVVPGEWRYNFEVDGKVEVRQGSAFRDAIAQAL